MRTIAFLRSFALLFATLPLLFLLGCGEEETEQAASTSSTPAIENVTFMAGFKAQANLPFVGAYVAKEKGFFREEGLEVEIQHSTGGGQHVQLLLSGDVQFTTADAANVLQRVADPGIPLVAVALIGQTGQQGWVTLADSGLDDPKDWAGKTVGYRGTVPPDLLAILKANGMTLDDVNEVNVGYQPPQLLVEGRVDVYPVFLSNEPDIIRRKLGKEVNVFRASDYGMPTLGLTYVTSEGYMREHPETVERFLRAALRGIEWARDNRDEAVDIVLKYASGEEREHQRFMLDAELEAADSDVTAQHGIGWQTEEQWQGLHDALIEYGALAEPVDVNAAFYNEFLRVIYESGGPGSP
ncbi:MAG: ABC transporter substrate-binding protein [Dehalococcoidia bacterium]|nr:ABC transporter substrate-binding protein [Dehalococcoidia bacterium]